MPTAPVVAQTLETRLLEVFLFLGSEWILYVLLGLSVISVAITIERLVAFYRSREDLEALSLSLDQHLTKGDLAEARSLLERSRSQVAKVALRGLDGLPRGAAAVEEIVLAATQTERLKMERGLAFLGTLGNNAPFIGLFGTVLGVIRSFRDLSVHTIEGSSAVMAGIAEALIATAVGLLVALPAVALFNAFQRYIKSKLAEADVLSRILLAYAKTARK